MDNTTILNEIKNILDFTHDEMLIFMRNINAEELITYEDSEN